MDSTNYFLKHFPHHLVFVSFGLTSKLPGFMGKYFLTCPIFVAFAFAFAFAFALAFALDFVFALLLIFLASLFFCSS